MCKINKNYTRFYFFIHNCTIINPPYYNGNDCRYHKQTINSDYKVICCFVIYMYKT